MVPFAGYEMPVQYEGIMAEHLWVRENAGLFDVSHMGQILFHGSHVDAALETLLPGELKLLGDMSLRYSMLLAEDGTIIDDLMATRRGEEFYVVVNGATKQGDLEIFEAAAAADDRRRSYARAGAAGAAGPEGGRGAGSRRARACPSLASCRADPFRAVGHPVWISRSGYTGEDGFEISIPSVAVQQLADWLVGDERVKPIGLGARDSLRLEAGLPLYGHDIDRTTTPVMAGLTFAIGKRRRAEGGFPGFTRILEEMRERPGRRSASASTSTAASRFAKARWSSTAKAMKSAGSPAAASRPACSGRSPWAMSRAISPRSERR